jgi:hypothetical protein
MKSVQEKASQILKENPSENQVFFTEDEQAFFTKLKAYNHNKNRGFDSEPIVFSREGYEPEKQQELQEELQMFKEENQKLSKIIEGVMLASDLSLAIPVIDQETPEAIVAVISLRELIADFPGEKEKDNSPVVEKNTSK